jgi:hypothetical protein
VPITKEAALPDIEIKDANPLVLLAREELSQGNDKCASPA